MDPVSSWNGLASVTKGPRWHPFSAQQVAWFQWDHVRVSLLAIKPGVRTDKLVPLSLAPLLREWLGFIEVLTCMEC